MEVDEDHACERDTAQDVARIAEALGRSDDARGYYVEFLRRYGAPDAAAAELVAAARRELAKLASPD
jgi:hypothetical protein